MKTNVTTALRGLVAGLALMATTASEVLAQDYPSKPIELVIHAGFGGGTDTTARLMMIRARRELGVDMIVNSQRGGAGARAHEYVAGKETDGYTVLAITPTHLFTMARGESNLKIEDFVGVARAMDDPNLIVVPANSPYQDLNALIAASASGETSFGVSEIGGSDHIAIVQLAQEAGFEAKAVPFGSGGSALQNVVSGAVSAGAANISEVIGQLQDGSVRALAVMAENRLPVVADVPTTYEQGVPIASSATRGYVVLKGTPEDRVARLSEAFVNAMEHETFRGYLTGSGLNPETSVLDSEAWTAAIQRDYEAAVQAMETLGLK